MQSVQTHFLLAEEICNYLDSNNKNYNKNAFLWGAQGLNFFMTSSNKSVQEIGKTIYQGSPYETLSFLTKYAQGIDNEIEKSYAMGFITHYALDSCTRSFVTFGANEMAKSDSNCTVQWCKNFIEVNLDTIMMRYVKGGFPSDVHLKNVAPKDDKVISHLSLLYSLLVKKVFDKDISVDEIALAEQEYVKWLKKHNDKTGFKKDFLIRKEKKNNIYNGNSAMYRSVTEDDSFDFANVKEQIWLDGTVENNSTFFELYEDSKNLAQKLIDKFLDNKDIEKDECKI